MRLIDANALIHRVVVERDAVEIKTGCDIGYHNGLNMAVSMAINAPTVDAVEVVRCKDCKHLYDGMDDCCCTSHRGLLRICENSFCSYGERKSDGKDA